MNYETIKDFQDNKNIYDDNFSKLKYGHENKVLQDFKNKIKYDDNKEYQINDKQKLNNLLKVEAETLVQNAIPNSFALKISFTLKAPYHSSDDDDFYIISNPCLKEKVFKVPMIRGSGIKGALLNGAREIIKEKNNNSTKVEYLKSYFRIFGVGNDEFRKLLDNLTDNELKLFFMLNGLAIDINGDVKEIFEKYKKDKAQKGRVVFYPTYFNKLSLEIINPHNRKTRAGTNPIHYEVVPKKTEGILQIVYIPFDGILESDKEIKKEANFDLEFLKEIIKVTLENRGIGAKTKLGWGRTKITNIECFWSER